MKVTSVIGTGLPEADPLPYQPAHSAGAGSLAVYVHVPFCKSRCRYCDFNTYAGLEALIPRYVVALQSEAAGAAALFRPGAFRFISSVFFGGGTPSLLRPSQVEAILGALRGWLPLDASAEITLEANPGTATLRSLAGFRAAGVNRLSIGVQSLDDRELRALGRIHSRSEALQAVADAARAGFQNTSLDLMYGLPGQRLSDWLTTLRAAAGLAVPHLSLYALTLEDETPMGRDVAGGALALPDEDLVAQMYESAEDLLAEAGYGHYEISNWALPGHECRHNLVYWRNQPYLGLGGGAHSSAGARDMAGTSEPESGGNVMWRRWVNVSHPALYFDALMAGRSPIQTTENLYADTVMWETAFLGLRLLDEGIGEDAFCARFGRSLESVFGKQLARAREQGLVISAGGRVRLTRRGRFLSNEVFAALAPERDATTARDPKEE